MVKTAAPVVSCDRCGPHVRAAWRVFTRNGSLFFCGHCMRIHAPALDARGFSFTVLDD